MARKPLPRDQVLLREIALELRDVIQSGERTIRAYKHLHEARERGDVDQVDAYQAQLELQRQQPRIKAVLSSPYLDHPLVAPDGGRNDRALTELIREELSEGGSVVDVLRAILEPFKLLLREVLELIGELTSGATAPGPETSRGEPKSRPRGRPAESERNRRILELRAAGKKAPQIAEILQRAPDGYPDLTADAVTGVLKRAALKAE